MPEVAYRMVLKLHAKAPASNKPPPASSPDEELFASPIDFSDGRRIWVSLPRPDKISIIGYLLAEHFKETFIDHIPLSEKVAAFADGLKGASELLNKKYPFEGKGNLLAKVQLPLGPRNSNVFVEVRKAFQDGELAFTMRLEFNPRKLGLPGCKQLQQKLFDSASGSFHFGAFLADARLTRLDVAIDYACVRPAELIVTLSGKGKEGKRVHYRGTDGALETVQVHRATKKPTVGTLGVKVYDKNRERQSHGKPPPYPGYEVTRVEIVKTRFKQGFSLAALAGLEDPFSKVRLSYAPELALNAGDKIWARYVSARAGVGHDEAVKNLNIQPIFRAIMKKRYENHPSNLLNQDLWGRWMDGLKFTGLIYLVYLALNPENASTSITA